jgi:hypothetical protein
MDLGYAQSLAEDTLLVVCQVPIFAILASLWDICLVIPLSWDDCMVHPSLGVLLLPGSNVAQGLTQFRQPSTTP